MWPAVRPASWACFSFVELSSPFRTLISLCAPSPPRLSPHSYPSAALRRTSTGRVEHGSERGGALWLRGCSGGHARGGLLPSGPSPSVVAATAAAVGTGAGADAVVSGGGVGGEEGVWYPLGGHVLLQSDGQGFAADAFTPLPLPLLSSALAAGRLSVEGIVAAMRAAATAGAGADAGLGLGLGVGVGMRAEGEEGPMALLGSAALLRCLLVQCALTAQQATPGHDSLSHSKSSSSSSSSESRAELCRLLTHHMPAVAAIAALDEAAAVGAAFAAAGAKVRGRLDSLFLLPLDMNNPTIRTKILSTPYTHHARAPLAPRAPTLTWPDPWPRREMWRCWSGRRQGCGSRLAHRARARAGRAATCWACLLRRLVSLVRGVWWLCMSQFSDLLLPPLPPMQEEKEGG